MWLSRPEFACKHVLISLEIAHCCRYQRVQRVNANCKHRGLLQYRIEVIYCALMSAKILRYTGAAIEPGQESGNLHSSQLHQEWCCSLLFCMEFHIRSFPLFFFFLPFFMSPSIALHASSSLPLFFNSFCSPFLTSLSSLSYSFSS